MPIIWHITGDKAGTFERVAGDEAAALCKQGVAQVCDGVTPLAYPEGHPHYSPKVVKTTAKKTTAKRGSYQRRDMRAEP